MKESSNSVHSIFSVSSFSSKTILVEKYEPYMTDYVENASVKRVKTLGKGTARNTAVRIISYSAFTIQ